VQLDDVHRGHCKTGTVHWGEEYSISQHKHIRDEQQKHSTSIEPAEERNNKQMKEKKQKGKRRGIVPDSLTSAHAFLQNPTRG
jgi:hypothetical protein